ncbi:hypothetical protein OPQ81_009107 [Rhizoctonia solani]|nr:hypothetical protein OPQ81_009107 [Rhizoctonia solani]
MSSTNMVDLNQFSLPDADGYRWKKLTSQNGAPFEVGVKEGEETGEQNPAPTYLNSLGSAAVDWPVNNDGGWKSSGIESRGIKSYRLEENPGSPWVYRLDIINTSGYYFTITDEGGDSYYLTTFANGFHSLKYNSSKPTIKFIN